MAINGKSEIMNLSVDDILRAKIARYYRFIPKFIVRMLERIVCQEQLNEILNKYGHLEGVDFAKAIIRHLNITLNVEGEENIPYGEQLPIFTCNHPLGALDGIALISLLGERYSGRFRFIVNDILMSIPPFGEIFLPVNKHGSQSKDAIKAIEMAYSNNFAIATFPAGFCSRNTHANIIEDLDWKKNVIAESIRYKRNIVPIYFDGYNSSFFYRLAKIRKHLCIKINIEMIYLPSEIFKSNGKTYTIRFGKPIPWNEFDSSRTLKQWADELKKRTYNLKTK